MLFTTLFATGLSTDNPFPPSLPQPKTLQSKQNGVQEHIEHIGSVKVKSEMVPPCMIAVFMTLTPQNMWLNKAPSNEMFVFGEALACKQQWRVFHEGWLVIMWNDQCPLL